MRSCSEMIPRSFRPSITVRYLIRLMIMERIASKQKASGEMDWTGLLITSITETFASFPEAKTLLRKSPSVTMPMGTPISSTTITDPTPMFVIRRAIAHDRLVGRAGEHIRMHHVPDAAREKNLFHLQAFTDSEVQGRSRQNGIA